MTTLGLLPERPLDRLVDNVDDIILDSFFTKLRVEVVVVAEEGVAISLMTDVSNAESGELAVWNTK